MFRNTGANAFAKNQMRLANEDKRDLYCIRYALKYMMFSTGKIKFEILNSLMSLESTLKTLFDRVKCVCF